MTGIEINEQKVLENAKTIAIVGCSPNKYRTSHYIAQFLMERGYKIIPVNPFADEILNETTYDSLKDIPEDFEIDIVNIFRDSSHTALVVEDASERFTSKNKPAIWTQLGVSSPEAEERASEYGFPYIRNKCIMVEWERYFDQ